jgi:hypothetical protein
MLLYKLPERTYQMKDINSKVQKVLEELIYDNGEIGLQVAAYLDGKLVINA